MILKNIEALKSYLSSPKNIVIMGHRNPDGDAVGSTLGLKHYLDKKGHTTQVVMPNEYQSFYTGYQVLKPYIVLIVKIIKV